MNTMRDVAMVAMGAAGAWAIIKYKEPMLKTMRKAVNKEKNMINKTLEDMM